MLKNPAVTHSEISGCEIERTGGKYRFYFVKEYYLIKKNTNGEIKARMFRRKNAKACRYSGRSDIGKYFFYRRPKQISKLA